MQNQFLENDYFLVFGLKCISFIWRKTYLMSVLPIFKYVREDLERMPKYFVVRSEIIFGGKAAVPDVPENCGDRHSRSIVPILYIVRNLIVT